MQRVLPEIDVDARGYKLSFSERTYIMGILNVTADSFSDGGKFIDRDRAVVHALRMAGEGADIIDVGGESTRPGARTVSVEEELDRVIPVIRALYGKVRIPISIDTRKSAVAEEALKEGASIVNDVSGLRFDKRTASVAAKYGAAVIAMHMKGAPRDMQDDPRYDDLIGEIIESLRGSIDIARRSGLSEGKIIIDPGIGFGKTVEHNLTILDRLGEFTKLSRPICIGTSRKSFIGKILGNDNAGDRLAGTLATCAVALMKGANLLRVHDVRPVLEAARIVDRILKRML